MKNVYDFPDFESVISSKDLSVAINEGDFLPWENGVNKSKATEGKLLLADVKSVRFL